MNEIGDVLKSIGATLLIAIVTSPLVPVLRTLGVNIYIYVCNRMRGKPTFVPGTRFLTLAAPSGARYGKSYIERVDFGYIYIRTENGGLLPIKKIRFKEYQIELMD